MEPIVVEVMYPCSREKVWNAITSHQEMVQWYFEQLEDFQPVPGFTTSFTVHSGDRDFVHQWEVTDVVPGERIDYEWLYPDYEGNGRVRFQLEDRDDHTLLRLLCWGIETFPQHIPEFSRESCTGGWKWFLEERLWQYLDC